MFPFAPLTRLVDWWTTSDAYRVVMRYRPSTIGLAALEVAREEIGRGEEGSNNHGPHIRRYGFGFGPFRAWCAKFVFFCLFVGAGRISLKLKVEQEWGARKLFRHIVASGMLVDLQYLQPGDIVLWSRGREGSWQAHIGIVSRVDRDELGQVTRWWYIAGNEGSFPALVAEHEGTRKKRRVGFARVGVNC